MSVNTEFLPSASKQARTKTTSLQQSRIFTLTVCEIDMATSADETVHIINTRIPLYLAKCKLAHMDRKKYNKNVFRKPILQQTLHQTKLNLHQNKTTFLIRIDC